MEGITIYAVVKSNRENYKTEGIDTTLYTSGLPHTRQHSTRVVWKKNPPNTVMKYGLTD